MKLKILSFNIHKGFNWNNTVATLGKIKHFLESVDADLVFLQEVVGKNEFSEKKYSIEMSKQFEFLADSLWNEYAYAKNAVYDGRHHGNVILSKYPIENKKVTNISTNSFEQRGILFCEIEYNQQIIHCYNVHLNLTHTGRRKQYKSILEEFKKNNSHEVPTILAGDFNDWNKKATSILSKDFSLSEAYASIHGEYAKTYPALYPFFRLDRIYTSKIEIIDAQTPDNIIARNISDHLPLLIEGEIK